MTLQEINEMFPDGGYIIIDGFDDAVVGIEPHHNKIIYDKTKMVDILMNNDKMNYEEAYEFLEFNVWTAYMGETTPIYACL
jgi:hypothetical protein